METMICFVSREANGFRNRVGSPQRGEAAQVTPFGRSQFDRRDMFFLDHNPKT
jgi:hypothetical protein